MVAVKAEWRSECGATSDARKCGWRMVALVEVEGGVKVSMWGHARRTSGRGVGRRRCRLVSCLRASG
eukprot:11860506-Heterocapsa_arctica.AAC.1